MNKGDHVGLSSTFEVLMKLLKNKIFYKLERTGEELEEVVGGLGKNKLHNTSIGGWAQQIRYFTNSDGSMRFVAGNKQLARANVILNDHVTITEDMILTGCAAGGAAGTYKLQIKRNDDDSVYADDIGSGANVPVSTFGNGTCTVQVCLYKNLELSQDLMFYPMLRAADVVDATFEPYYNKLGPSGEQSDWTESDSTSLAFIKNKPTLGTAAAKDTPASGDASATQVVMGNDSRLTNSRTPTSHTHTKSQITDFPALGTAASKDTPASGNASATQVVMGNDSRLTDSRNPTSHTHSKSQITDFPTLGTAAAKDTPVSGNASATQVVMGNDSRLTDARNAADVYSWAKASTKPTYTASEVGALASNGKASTAGTADQSTKVYVSGPNAYGTITASATDLGSGASLGTGNIYLVYG